MTADIIQIRDWDWLRPPDAEPRTGDAAVLILPVVRVERAIAEVVKPKPAKRRRSLLGDPA